MTKYSLRCKFALTYLTAALIVCGGIKASFAFDKVQTVTDVSYMDRSSIKKSAIELFVLSSSCYNFFIVIEGDMIEHNAFTKVKNHRGMWSKKTISNGLIPSYYHIYSNGSIESYMSPLSQQALGVGIANSMALANSQIEQDAFDMILKTMVHRKMYYSSEQLAPETLSKNFNFYKYQIKFQEKAKNGNYLVSTYFVDSNKKLQYVSFDPINVASNYLISLMNYLKQNYYLCYCSNNGGIVVGMLA